MSPSTPSLSAPNPTPPPRRAGVSRWALSEDRKQRAFLMRNLIGATGCITGVVALNLGLAAGICRYPQAVALLTWLSLVPFIGFYGLLRSGWNKRLSDPSLTLPQILSATSFLAAGYWLAGHGQGVALVLLATMLLFGMFAATPRQIGWASVWALLSFGAAMLHIAITEQDSSAQALQAIHFGVLVVVLGIIFLLAAQLAHLRRRLRNRKEDLARALARIQELATRDELTGLINRRQMLVQLGQQQQRAQRAGTEFCLCLIDLDHFKQINDQHGHGVGDEVLGAFAAAATVSLRDTDVIARWGGEEFLVLLPDSCCEAAAQPIERLRETFAAATLSRGVPELRASFSAGLVCCPGDEPLQQAIERADGALYRAKAEGRGRTVIA